MCELCNDPNHKPATDKADTPFVPLNIAILTVSDTRTLDEDSSGKFLKDSLLSAGHTLIDCQLTSDDVYQIRAVISAWIADARVNAIITTGGTGFYHRDNMPEAVGVLLDKEVAGFGEMFRHLSYHEIGMATLQSRAVAGMANNTVIFCLPGSTGACRTAWENIIKDQLDSRTRPCNFVPHLLRENPSH